MEYYRFLQQKCLPLTVYLSKAKLLFLLQITHHNGTNLLRELHTKCNTGWQEFHVLETGSIQGTLLLLLIPGVQSAGWLDIHFTVGTICERAAPLAAARHHVLRSLIRLHNEHRVYASKVSCERRTLTFCYEEGERRIRIPISQYKTLQIPQLTIT
jgi:hypothetical protein